MDDDRKHSISPVRITSRETGTKTNVFSRVTYLVSVFSEFQPRPEGSERSFVCQESTLVAINEGYTSGHTTL